MSGLIGAYKPTHVETQLTNESIRLYKKLTEMGHETGWKQCGSLLLARTRDRMTHYHRMKAQSVSRSIECHILSNDEVSKKYPYMYTKDLQGALFIPGDGVADPLQVTMLMTICWHIQSHPFVRGVVRCPSCTP